MATRLGRGLLALVTVLLVLGFGFWWMWRMGNDTGLEDLRRPAELPRTEAAGLDDEALARALVERWLHGFTTEAGWAARLRDFRIDRLDTTRRGDRLEVAATFRVQPTRWSLDNWLAGSGGTVEGGWIRGKYTRFEITETADGYRLREIGPAP